MQSKAFDATRGELEAGINLIEASAGTGKTYTIAMLVLRFVVECQLDIKQLLVVTFTKAASEELKDRIRARLSEARQILLNPAQGDDPAITAWLAGLTLDSASIRQRLELALLDIDQAAIFTIHGFCQRVLAEHALESGQLFDCELSGDVAELKLQCADDFWRRQIYQRPAWQAALLLRAHPTPDALLASVLRIDLQQNTYPLDTNLDADLAALPALRAAAAAQLPTVAETLIDALEAGYFSASFATGLPQRLQALAEWLQDPEQDLPDFDCLNQATLLAGLNGIKFRSSKNKPLPAEEQKQQYLASLEIDCAPFEALADAVRRLPVAFRAALLASLRSELDRRLLRENVLSFDDLITRLAAALDGDNGALLAAELRVRFRAALIDEFQDTDAKQWRIFSGVFASTEHYLYLIGDPKQAIYKFRGADIFSYFAAQQRADRHYTLLHNWRSHPHLVQAVNRLFRRQKPFLFDQLDFTPVMAGRQPGDGSIAGAPLVLWQLDKNPGKQEHWTARKGSSGEVSALIEHAVVAEISRLLAAGRIAEKHGAERPVQASDIAILVRSNAAAAAYQQALLAAGIPAVLNSKQSVFASAQACELYHVLRAVAGAGQIDLLKQALVTPWFGLDGQQLYRLSQDEAELDAWVSRFQDYLQCWRNQGVLATLQQLLRRERIEQHLSAQPQAERVLTNIHHLAERLQQAAIDEHLAINKTLDWLRRAIQQAAQDSSEDRQLRLESDEDAVKIVTLHSSKGLEYPLVFCPDLWRRSDRLKTETALVQCHEQGTMVADLGSAQFAERREQALFEELAEDLRLFYVALTRAKYRCYLNWADVRTKERANDSAMAYLFEFADCDFAGQQQVLQQLASGEPDLFEYRLLPAEAAGELAELPADRRAADLALAHRVKTRSLHSIWQMSSYTALAALSLEQTPELPADKAEESHGQPAGDEALPRGAHTGNVIHSLLETVAFADLAARCDIGRASAQACLRYGLQLAQPQILSEVLYRVTATPLSEDSGFCLKNLEPAQCIKEMPFYLSMPGRVDTARINRILAACPAYQALDAKQISGYLTGFIDLVCCYGGRYFVMDYKTNALADYSQASLLQAMREHNYGLQYWLYSLVLHAYLSQRLPDYDYARHFGGVKYLFVRGMDPERPASGVFADRPEPDRLAELAEVFFRA
ncbi:exodeoxyribonuclease V subunit beta [Methylomonas sp. SURF-1]|uniref:RecBCD enzyme subunit RecB n=1 Tax=Methylomonas aurea TaxID=2952224 RepID=A0ABT1UBE0_9GAMM|nr:exodeoxyribonuclease V subunit beta [Methylomonas sp. SURF-1]MCQ8179537.1 exodeoxyribonuclease V subunit beta [Methylomonas sp. SURF-1]